MYRYFLDNTLVDEPQGFDDFVTNILRDDSLKGIFISKDISLTFRGSGYEYLKDNFDTLGHCVEIQARVEQYRDGNWFYFYEGVIFLTDVVWQDFNKQASVRLTERSYSARIVNNKSIGIIPTSEISKNLSTAITPATVRDIGLFDPSTSSVVGVPCAAVRVDETLDNMVQWMSDAEMELTSDYFSDPTWLNFNLTSNQNYDKGVLMLTTGYAIRQAGAGVAVTDEQFSQNMKGLSFDTLFDTLNKQFRIRMSIDQLASPRVLRIEPEAHFRTTSNVHDLSDVQEVVTKTDKTKLFNKVKFGSSEVLNASSVDFPENIRFVGFNKEEYYVIGQCNIETTLDLETQIITSSNVIQYCIDNPSDTQYDEDWVLIHATERLYLGSAAVYSDAIYSNWLGSASSFYFYNELFTNSYVANRYLGGVPNSIALSLVEQDNSFEAITNVAVGNTLFTPTTFAPIGFNVELSDPNGNYNLGTYEYAAPQNGSYAFSVNLPIYYINAVPTNGVSIGAGKIEAYLDVYDSGGFGGTLLYSRTLFNQTVNHPFFTVLPLTLSHTVSLTAGEIVIVRVVLTNTGPLSIGVGTYLRINAGASFACTASATGGGIYNEYDPTQYPVLIHEMKHPLTDEKVRSIEAGATGQISFSVNGELSKTAWIETIKHNHRTGIADIKLISNKILNG